MRTQRLIIPVVAGIAVFGTVSAFAASISLGSETLGSGNVAVASCTAATPVVASYTTAFATGGYTVTDVTIASPIACDTKQVRVTLTNSLGASLGEVTGAVTGTSTTLTLAAPVSAAAVTGISAVIAG